jgi:hypothetical protein
VGNLKIENMVKLKIVKNKQAKCVGPRAPTGTDHRMGTQFKS